MCNQKKPHAPCHHFELQVTSCCWIAGSSVTSETRFLSADQPEGEWKVILPRVNNVEYDIRHRGDHFFIEIRDADRPNSEVLVVPVSDPTQTKVLLLECRGTAAQLLAQTCMLAGLHGLPRNTQTYFIVFNQSPMGLRSVLL